MSTDRRGAAVRHHAAAAKDSPYRNLGTLTMAEALEAIADHIRTGVATAEISIAFGELTIKVEGPQIVSVLTWLRDDPQCRFKLLVDIAGADYPNRARRFDVVYHLLSIEKNRRIRIKVETDETTAIPSAVSVFPAADW